jgi:hypothetical protein
VNQRCGVAERYIERVVAVFQHPPPQPAGLEFDSYHLAVQVPQDPTQRPVLEVLLRLLFGGAASAAVAVLCHFLSLFCDER